jgi:uncharacterized protein
MNVISEQMYINLPVNDLEKSLTFYKSLGFDNNPQFTNDVGACIIINPNTFVMLVTKPFFAQFTKKAIADATQTTEVLLAIGKSSREEVDQFVDRAIANGGFPYAEATDHGFMYQRVFADLDGHQWEVGFMDLEKFKEMHG